MNIREFLIVAQLIVINTTSVGQVRDLYDELSKNTIGFTENKGQVLDTNGDHARTCSSAPKELQLMFTLKRSQG